MNTALLLGLNDVQQRGTAAVDGGNMKIQINMKRCLLLIELEPVFTRVGGGCGGGPPSRRDGDEGHALAVLTNAHLHARSINV